MISIELIKNPPSIYSYRYDRELHYSWYAKNKQETIFSNCRGYLQDDLKNFYNQLPSTSGIKHTLDLESTRLMLYWKENEKKYSFDELIENIINLLNQVEEKLGFEKTTYDKVSDKENCFALIGDKRWQISLAILSFYTLLMRVGVFHNKNSNWEKTLEAAKNSHMPLIKGGDCSEAGKVLHILQRITETGYEKYWNEDNKYKNISDLGNSHSAGYNFYEYVFKKEKIT